MLHRYTHITFCRPLPQATHSGGQSHHLCRVSLPRSLSSLRWWPAATWGMQCSCLEARFPPPLLWPLSSIAASPTTNHMPACPLFCSAVTRAESGQQKRLLLLDRSGGWEVAEELPLDLGPRYFAAAALQAAPLVEPAADVDAAEVAAAEQLAPEFELQLPGGLRAGDRLLVTLPTAAAKQHQKALKKLELQGAPAGTIAPAGMVGWLGKAAGQLSAGGASLAWAAVLWSGSTSRAPPSPVPLLPDPPSSPPPSTGVEIEVFTPPQASAAPRISAADGEGPLQLWERYCAWQRLPPPVAEAGSGLLRALLSGGNGSGAGSLEQPHTAIEFRTVELEGYFRCVRSAADVGVGGCGRVWVGGRYNVAVCHVGSVSCSCWEFTSAMRWLDLNPAAHAHCPGGAMPLSITVLYTACTSLYITVCHFHPMPLRAPLSALQLPGASSLRGRGPWPGGGDRHGAGRC